MTTMAFGLGKPSPGQKCRAPDKRGIKDSSKIIFLFLNQNICCDPSIEPSRRDGSNNVSQNMVFGEIWIIIPKSVTPSYLKTYLF